MLSAFVPHAQGLVRVEQPPLAPIPADAVWIDLLEPTPEEEKHVERSLGVAIPTPEEMREIEASSRLYEEDGVLYMTATIATRFDADLPESAQVTFILADSRLVTNRYVDPLPFRRFIAHAQARPAACSSPAVVLAGLLEAIVNRMADVLERVAGELDSVTALVFSPPRPERAGQRDFRGVLQRVGQNGEVISKARESLVSLGRLLVFLQQHAPNGRLTDELRARLRTLSRDVIAMSDYASFLNDKLQFVLDATLGMINIDQNDILKIFSVVTVVLLPPSVIGAFYGMNFQHMPWQHAPWGHWAALALMVASAIIPYLLVKRRGWL